MERKEELKTMLQDIINDRPEQASVALHNYLTDKIRDVAGTAPQQHVTDDASDLGDEQVGEE